MSARWEVSVTPEPGPVGIAEPNRCSPDEPVSSSTGTGGELPTLTSTVGRAPDKVPWPPRMVMGTLDEDDRATADIAGAGELHAVPTTTSSTATTTTTTALAAGLLTRKHLSRPPPPRADRHP